MTRCESMQELRDAVSRVSVKHCPLKTVIQLFQVGPTTASLSLSMFVPERDSGEPVHIERSTAIAFGLPHDFVVDIVRDLIIQMWIHEANEHILVDGVRKYDPHATSDDQKDTAP